MRGLFHLLQGFVGGHALGGLLLLALAALGGAALATLVAAVRGVGGRRAVACLAGTTAVSLALAWVRVELAQREALSLLLGQDFAQHRPYALAVSLERIHVTHAVVSAAVGLSLAVVAGYVLRRRPLPGQTSTLVVCLGVACLTCALLHLAQSDFTAGSQACSESLNRSACWFERVTGTVRRFRDAVSVVLLAALVGWTCLLWEAVRDALRGRCVSGRASGVSTALLLAGGTAFWLTRAEHADAARLVPPDPSSATRALLAPDLHQKLPLARAGCSRVDGPVVELGPSGVTVDAQPIRTPEELRQNLQGKRELQQLLSSQHAIAPAALVAAPAATPARELAPWLRAALGSGYPRVSALTRLPLAPFPTRTVGVLQLRRICAAPVDLTHLDRHAIWADWVGE